MVLVKTNTLDSKLSSCLDAALSVLKFVLIVVLKLIPLCCAGQEWQTFMKFYSKLSSCLAAALSVIEFVNIFALHLVTFCCTA